METDDEHLEEVATAYTGTSGILYILGPGK